MSQPVAECGAMKNRTDTGLVSNGPCQMIGFYVHSTTSGTVAFKDGGSGGTAIGSTITPGIGFHRFPGMFGGAAFVTIGGTIDVTFFFASAN